MSDLAIVWFRRDFRLADHPALHHACSHHAQVLPVYIHDPNAMGDWSPGAATRWWLHHALADLARRIQDKGSTLIVRVGPAQEELNCLIDQTGASAVYWNRLYEPALVERDTQIKSALAARGLCIRSFRAAALFEPWELLKDDGSPYRVFTPFWRRMQKDWRAVHPAPEPERIEPPTSIPNSAWLDALQLRPTIRWDAGLAGRWQPTESGASEQLDAFLETTVVGYDQSRDRPDQRGTSSMSPYLHFGQISPTQIVHRLNQRGEVPLGTGALSFVRELAWREFSMLLLHHFPATPDQALV
ncbi:MAG: deoxyribodipyrimidine photo-lyase, partial [Pseudomonadota bacterium]